MVKESFESRLWRWGGNLFPAYRGTGARAIRVGADFHDVVIKLPCNWKTKNHMGITWGGSLYAALDPIYGLMLYKLLGRQYRVVDSKAEIRFLKPVRETLYAHFHIRQSELSELKERLTQEDSARIQLHVCLKNKAGKIHAQCEKHIHISRNDVYEIAPA